MNIDGDKKLVLGVVGLVCVTVLCVLLFIALWAYKEIVATTLLVLLVLIVVVYLWGLINEQRLRHIRYHHREETPLSASHYPPYAKAAQTTGPYYMPAQPNPYYQSSADSDQRQREDVKY